MSDQQLDGEKIMLLLGKILGEIYRMQRHVGMSTEGPAVSYALCHGFEHVLTDTFREIGGITTAQVDAVDKVLDLQTPAAFKGFYDIEYKLQAEGVCRETAIRILTYLKATGLYDSIIDKMDCSRSPSECRTFDLDEWSR